MYLDRNPDQITKIEREYENIKNTCGNSKNMFGGNDMSKMMKQMGMDMEEIDADKVEVTIGEKKLVFKDPSLSKIEAKGQEIFQLQGDYSEVEDVSSEDVKLVMEKTGCSEEEARDALKDAEDVAEAVMNLQ